MGNAIGHPNDCLTLPEEEDYFQVDKTAKAGASKDEQIESSLFVDQIALCASLENVTYCTDRKWVSDGRQLTR